MALDDTHRLSLPEQKMMGVLHFGVDDAGASEGNDPPMLTTPPSSLGYDTGKREQRE